MSVLYGKRCPRYETSETVAFFIAQHEWELLLEPGATPPLDLLPILRRVPERWAKWKTDVSQCRKHQRDLYFGLLDETKARMEKGEENGSYMEEVIGRQEEFEMDREMMGYVWSLGFPYISLSVGRVPDAHTWLCLQIPRWRSYRRGLRHHLLVPSVDGSRHDCVPRGSEEGSSRT